MKLAKLIATLFLIGLTIYVASNPTILENMHYAVQNFSLTEVLGIFVLFLLMRIFQTLALQKVLDCVCRNITFFQSFELMAIKGFFNLGLSGGGLVAQMARAKSRLNIGMAELAVASLIQSLVLVIVLGSLFAVTAVSSISIFRHQVILFSFGTLVSITFTFGLYLVVSRSTLFRKLKKILPTRLEWPEVRMQTNIGKGLLFVFVAQFLFVFARLARFVYIAFLIDPTADVLQLAFGLLAGDLGAAFPVTPGGIGVRELVIGSGGAYFGWFELFLAAAVVDRAASFIFNIAHLVLSALFYRVSDSRGHD